MSEKITIDEALEKIERVNQLFLKNKDNFSKRPLDKMLKVGQILLANKQKYAEVITSEMGKPVYESIAEIEKSALNCRFYVDNCEEFLKDKTYSTDRYDALVRYEPLGVILGIMPWNFPFWQVFRFAVPTILAGNKVIVKHASNVPQSAQLIEEIFLEAGFEEGTYTNLSLDSKYIEKVIESPFVKAVSLTGSEEAGSSVASIAGKNIKKTVLELGGSNAFIILDDADLDLIIDKAINARYRNAGQSCIAAKRFLVQEGIFEEFLSRFSERVKALKMGDPFDSETEIGPLARLDLAKDLEKQVNDSLKMGAEIVCGGKRKDAFYEPTILINVNSEMPVFKEETFGPVAVLVKIKSFEEAVKLSNDSNFGLGVSICTQQVDKYLKKAHLFDEGAVFFNQLVRSDPQLPFGGVKKSGYGRELSKDGIHEFVNTKTIVISKE